MAHSAEPRVEPTEPGAEPGVESEVSAAMPLVEEAMGTTSAIPDVPGVPGVTASLRFGVRLTPAVLAARRAYVGPLFDYCRDHGIICIRVARRAALAVGAGHITRNRLMRIKSGAYVTPPWFIAAVCREIGQPIEIVMGAEWAQRHLPTLTPDVPFLGGALGGALGGERRAS